MSRKHRERRQRTARDRRALWLKVGFGAAAVLLGALCKVWATPALAPLCSLTAPAAELVRGLLLSP